MSTPKSALPSGIGKPAQRALAPAGYTRLEQLAKVSEAELSKLHQTRINPGTGCAIVLPTGRELLGNSLGVCAQHPRLVAGPGDLDEGR